MLDLVCISLADYVTTIFLVREKLTHSRVRNWLPCLIHQQVLLGYICNVTRVFILCQQVIKRLIFPGSDILWDRLPPFIGVGKLRVYVKNDPSKRKKPVANDRPELEFSRLNTHAECYHERQQINMEKLSKATKRKDCLGRLFDATLNEISSQRHVN